MMSIEVLHIINYKDRVTFVYLYDKKADCYGYITESRERWRTPSGDYFSSLEDLFWYTVGDGPYWIS